MGDPVGSDDSEVDHFAVCAVAGAVWYGKVLWYLSEKTGMTDRPILTLFLLSAFVFEGHWGSRVRSRSSDRDVIGRSPGLPKTAMLAGNVYIHVHKDDYVEFLYIMLQSLLGTGK
jgi:hypothetical protein